MVRCGCAGGQHHEPTWTEGGRKGGRKEGGRRKECGPGRRARAGAMVGNIKTERKGKERNQYRLDSLFSSHRSGRSRHFYHIQRDITVELLSPSIQSLSRARSLYLSRSTSHICPLHLPKQPSLPLFEGDKPLNLRRTRLSDHRPPCSSTTDGALRTLLVPPPRTVHPRLPP